MQEITVNKFRANLKDSVEQVISNHEPIKVSRRSGGGFIVIGVDDWEREQETLYVLQNSSLIKQIALSTKTHNKGRGYKPKKEDLDEINSV